MVKRLTLGFIIKDGKILLGMKKRGFGVGKWNGFGGKIEGTETPAENLKREFLEEVGLNVIKSTPRGQLYFHYNHIGDIFVGHLFEVNEYEGEITESEEMRPEWFSIAEIPYEKMWLDDLFWLPKYLKGENIKATFHFVNYDTITSQNIE